MTTTQSTGPVVARAGSYYRRTRYIMFIVLFGFGVYAIYDGFKGYPEHNRKFDEINAKIDQATKENRETDAAALKEELRKHGDKQSEFNVLFNKIVGIALPPLSLLMIGWVLHRSRGEIRLENETLHVPGHPPVPFSAITALDQRLWDRKGIAQVEYALPEGARGKFTLDDFIYDRPPIDAMYEAIVAYVKRDESAGRESSDSTPAG
jgi:hypothetical protein